MTARYFILGTALALRCLHGVRRQQAAGRLYRTPLRREHRWWRPRKSDPLQVAAPQPLAQTASAGAIFQVGSGYSGLVTGTRARSLGDMVTIILTENTITTKSTAGQTNRSGSFGLTPPTSGPLDFLNPDALKSCGRRDVQWWGAMPRSRAG